MKKLTQIIHIPTFFFLMIIFVVCTVLLLFIPHNAEGFGRMNVHQGYAEIGKIASLGLVDRTLVDWYMLGPTLEENIKPYNRIVYTSIGILTPVFVAWCLVIASIVGICKKQSNQMTCRKRAHSVDAKCVPLKANVMTRYMKKNVMKKLGIFAALISLAFLPSCSDFEGGTSKSMQEDFDKIRLDHILVIDNLVQEFKTATGKYPFEDDLGAFPVVVIIQTETQKKSHKEQVPIFLDLETRIHNGEVPEQPSRIDFKTVQDLEKELSKGLNRPISLPKDPQKIPVNKPSVYLYTYYLGVYDITAFLHHEQPFARVLGPFCNKITIGNRSAPQAGIWKVEELVQVDDFREFFLAPFNRSGYNLKTQLQ